MATNRAQYKEIIISHPGTDFDSLASMWAVHLLYPERPCVLIGGEDSNVRQFLNLYGHEFKLLRLRNLDISSVKHLTIVDCSSRSQLAKIEGLLDRSDIQVELWDHHRDTGLEFRVDKKHYASVGANTTMLVSELQRSNVIISSASATLMMLGIYEDTGSLRFSSTTPSDIHASAWLLEIGANLDIVDKFLEIKLTASQKRLLTMLGLNVRVVEIAGINVHVTQAVAHEYVDEIAYLARKIQETESADVIFALVQLNDRVFIVGRSRLPSVDVGRILSIFGGGGHSQAASCLLPNTTHPIALQHLLDALREFIKPSIRAMDIMTSPVKTISPDSTISEADSIIARTGHSGLVVIDDDQKVIGIITRREVDKALVHNLGHAPVKGYMVREPFTVSVDTTINELQDIIIEHHAGFLPVIFGGRLTGIVTRTDVLNAIHKSGYRKPKRPAEPMTKAEFEEKGKDILSKLQPEYLMLLAIAGETADRMNMQCYLVGGAVRDLILGTDSIDIDILIEGDGLSFARSMAEELNGKVVENSRFRTAKLILPDNLCIDIATAREEFYIRPGALPEVEAASIKDDLLRRDFTINTLAIQLNSRKWGKLIDHFGGLEDLEKGLICVLHTFSFVDDPTRILRALRFSARYNFPLGKQTEELLKRALLEGRLDDVSPERVRDELNLCLREKNPWPVLYRLWDEGALALLHLFPIPPMGLKNPEDPIGPIIDWLIKALPASVPFRKDLAYLGYLISACEPEEARAFVSYYHFDSTVIKMADTLEVFKHACIKLEREELRASEIVQILESLSPHLLPSLIVNFEESSSPRNAVVKYVDSFMSIQPRISGIDLINEGFKPGPEFKDALEHVRKARLDGLVNTREEELELARKFLANRNNQSS